MTPGVGGTILYHVEAIPLNPSVNSAQPIEARTITAFQDFQQHGLKGLNIRDPNVLPKNLGGLEAVSEGATTLAISFAAGVTAGSGAFTADASLVEDGTSELAAGTYYYAATLIGKRSETGVGTSAVGISYKEAIVETGQRVDLSLAGGVSANLKRRIYRGPSFGIFEGFWELPNNQVSFSDRGTTVNPFTGRDMPPQGYQIQSLAEADANYAVVVTPSWNTNAWVTNKATTGFTINFGTAAPAGATVQWLLFRP